MNRLIYELPELCTEYQEPCTPTEAVLQVANWDRIDYNYKRKILVLMHKAFYDNLPEALNTGMHFNIGKTRGRDRYKFEIPRCSKDIGRVLIRYRGPLLWNSLLLDQRKVDTLGTFKSLLKREKRLIKSVSFLKEASVVRYKYPDFIHF